MRQELDPPHWLLRASEWVQKLGAKPALILFCLLSLLISLALSQFVISLLGQGNRWAAAACATVCALAFSITLGRLSLSALDYAQRLQRSLNRYGTQDEATGVFNQRHFLSLVERECSLARRYEMDCALVLIDVDHFRRVGQAFGRSCAEMLLRQIAEAIAETLRQADVLARYGSQEFILFLPHTDPLGALDVADRIRERVESLDFAWNGFFIPVSVSLGVAALRPASLSLDQLISQSEAGLEKARKAGRNCVRAAESSEPGKPRYFNF